VLGRCDVVDGKSRPLVRMFITRSSSCQAPKRRRRPKNHAAGLSLKTKSSVAVAASSLCHMADVKQEPPSAEVSHSLQLVN